MSNVLGAIWYNINKIHRSNGDYATYEGVVYDNKGEFPKSRSNITKI